MALEVTIGGSGTIFVGEDKIVYLEVLDVDLNPVDTATWAVDCVVAKTDVSSAILTIHTTVTGTFNVSRVVNTQRRAATFTDTQLNLFRAGIYRHGWKRMDDGSKTYIAYGNFTPQKGPVP